MNNPMTEAQHMTKLLEESILPLMAEMIKAMGENSYRYEDHIKDIKEKVEDVKSSTSQEKENKEEILKGLTNLSELADNLYEKSTIQEDAFNVLVKTITTFGAKLTDLIDTNNQLVNHQQNQIDRMEDVILAFEENTSRLDTLTLTIEGYTKEGLEHNIPKMDHFEYSTDLSTIKNGSEPIHKVLDREIKKFKNNTKR